MRPEAIVIDDDDAVREAIVGLVRSAGHRAVGFASADHYLARAADEPPGCLVLDIAMPGTSGLALQSRLSRAGSAVPIIFVSGQADVPMSVRALKSGAVDFFTKPFDAEELLSAILVAIGKTEGTGAMETESREDARPRAEPADLASIRGIVGASSSLRRVLKQVTTVAGTDSTVLIEGETGTGKERIARAVHELGPRRNGAFVKVNCAAVPSGLLESELMGHERGAFTGAVAQRIGRFELAHNGTIFLDEIGEMPLELQPKLLRLLQEREFERVGGTRTIRANVRVVAATNRDLAAMTARRAFRDDLYYRLSVFPITLPPLRERREDIPLLVRHFLAEVAQRMGQPTPEPTPALLDKLAGHDWPGNIRELQNVVERAMILAEHGALDVALPARVGVLAPPASPRSDGLEDVSRAHILRVLEETNWVVAGPNGAAARLAMKRTTLNFRMRKLGIVRPHSH
jgi:DNA-binding NtrC family response regulator